MAELKIKSVEFNTTTMFFNLKIEGLAGMITCAEDQKEVLFRYSLVDLRGKTLHKNGLACSNGRLYIADALAFTKAYALPAKQKNVVDIFDSLTEV